EENALQLAMIEPSFPAAALADLDVRIVKFRVAAHCLRRILDRRPQVPIGWSQGGAGTRKLKQGIDQFGHAMHSQLHFLIEFFALILWQISLTQELRVGNDRSERMAQIVRDGV